MNINPKTRSNIAEQCKSLASQINEFDRQTLFRVEQLGTQLGFGELDLHLEIAYAVSALVSEVHPENISILSLVKLRDMLNEVKSSFEKIYAFDPAHVNALDTRSSILAEIKSKVLQLEDLAMTVLQPVASAESVRRMVGNPQVTSMSKELESRLEVLDEHIGRSDEVLSKLQAQIPSRSISEHAAAFRSQANWHATLSVLSLIAAVLCGVALLNALGDRVTENLQLIGESPSNAQLIIALSNGLAIPSLCLVGLVVALRVFASERHNTIVNRHRASALDTFRAFVDASSEPVTREAILMQTTSCIFSHQSTGYLKGPIEVNNLPLGVLGATGKVGGD